MRVDRVPGKCMVKGYDKGGWFAIEGFNFGFNAKEEKKKDPPDKNNKVLTAEQKKELKKKEALEKKKAQRREAQQAKDPPDREEFTSMRISKQVDTATVYLMKQAMKAGADPANSKEDDLTADIHIVGSMLIEEEHLYVWAKIRLEMVQLTKWSVSASGDGRPNEAVTLQYKKAAIWYQGSEGTFLDASFTDGWNQTDNSRWRFEKFDDARRALEKDGDKIY